RGLPSPSTRGRPDRVRVRDGVPRLDVAAGSAVLVTLDSPALGTPGTR
ncbi:MAG: hypothetical protein V7603_2513, partial [Micromonosporaceae bacterium]